MYTYRLYFQLQLNRFLGENELISPGGYTFISNGKEYIFDFENYEGWTEENSGKDGFFMVMQCKNPDYNYENSSEITPDVIANISKIEDFYLDLEGCEEDLKVLGINNVQVLFYFQNGGYAEFNLPDKMFEEVLPC